MMKSTTFDKEILEACKKIVIEKGLNAVSMRTVAKECHVAVGSIYNYYNSKEDLIISTIESIWTEIIQDIDLDYQTNSFIDYLSQLFDQIHDGCQKYPQFFTIHALSFTKSSKEKGRQAMANYFEKMKGNMLTCLHNDQKIRKDLFDEHFKDTDFIDYVFSNFIATLADSSKSRIFLLELIKKVLYLHDPH